MAMLDLNEIVSQREEATGVDGGRVPFKWGGEVYSFLDPVALPDDVAEELREVSDSDAETALLLMGEDMYEKFLSNGGSAARFGELLITYNNEVRDYMGGKASRGNRSSRRMAERARAKRP